MVDSAYGWNIISDELFWFFFKIHGQIETEHYFWWFLVDLSISWHFPHMTTIACWYVGIWDQLVFVFVEWQWWSLKKIIRKKITSELWDICLRMHNGSCRYALPIHGFQVWSLMTDFHGLILTSTFCKPHFLC